MDKITMTPFPALHNRSYYSILAAGWSVETMVETLAARGYQAAALTDLASISGVAEFWRTCRRHGIRPLLGVELPMELPFLQGLTVASARGERRDNGTILALVENDRGYTNVCRLLSHHGDGIRVSLQRLEQSSEGLWLTTSGRDGVLARAWERDGDRGANKMLRALAGSVPEGRLFVQLFHQGPTDRVRCLRWSNLARTNGLATMVACEARCRRAADTRLLRTLASVATCSLLADEDPMKPGTDESFHLRSAAAVEAHFDGYAEALAASRTIAGNCRVPLLDEAMNACAVQ